MGNIDTRNRDIFAEVLSDHKELSSLPQTLVEVIKVSSDPDSSASDMARVIKRDPPLTARLLRIVNSPYYGLSNKISSVRQAIIAMGLQTVSALALSASVYNITAGVKSSVDRKKFWRHSLEVAITSKMIAIATGYKPTDEAFVTGLLHDIGILIMEPAFPDDFAKIEKLVQVGESRVALEQNAWNTDHARAGQFLLDQWNLPKIIGAAVSSHHCHFKENDKSKETHLAQIIGLANLLSRFRISSAPPPDSKTLANKDIIVSNLKLSSAKIENICRDLVSEVVKESGYLEIDIGTPEELLAEANDMLFKQITAAEQLLRENQNIKNQIDTDKSTGNNSDNLKTAIMTVSYHLNSIMEILENKISQIEKTISDSEIVDQNGTGLQSIRTISRGIESANILIEELKDITYSSNDSTRDYNRLTEIENRIKNRLASPDKL